MNSRSITVIDITRTCPALPAQWEGSTEDDCGIYIRYRHG